jgi:cyanate permease
MASKTERTVINAAGLVQGIVLVTFPAASTIFTDTSEYGLSSSQYGAMFLPQVALAIATSLLGAGLARRTSAKRVYLLGLACSIVSMVLLLISSTVRFMIGGSERSTGISVPVTSGGLTTRR